MYKNFLVLFVWDRPAQTRVAHSIIGKFPPKSLDSNNLIDGPFMIWMVLQIMALSTVLII